jgi:hypothetical protein
MTLAAILSMFFGAMLAIGNTTEVVRGETFNGLSVSTPMAILGLAGAAFSVMLFAGGVGTWQVRPYGRILSMAAAVAMIILNVAAAVLFDFPLVFTALGSLYPVILLIAFNSWRWKEAFSAAGPRRDVPMM